MEFHPIQTPATEPGADNRALRSFGPIRFAFPRSKISEKPLFSCLRRCRALLLGLPVLVKACVFNDYRTLLVSRSDGADGQPAIHDSSEPSISLDGHYVAYVGRISPYGCKGQVYLRNTDHEQTELISRSSAVPEQTEKPDRQPPAAAGTFRLRLQREQP